MNYLKEKNKMRPIWKTKRDQLFLNSTDKDKDYFLKNFISTFNELDGKVVAGYNHLAFFPKQLYDLPHRASVVVVLVWIRVGVMLGGDR